MFIIINHFLHISFTLFNSLSTVDLIQGRTLLTLPKTPGMLKPAQPWPRDTTPICVARTLPFTWGRGQVNVVWKICSILSNAFGHFKLGKLVLDFSYILQPFYLIYLFKDIYKWVAFIGQCIFHRSQEYKSRLPGPRTRTWQGWGSTTASWRGGSSKCAPGCEADRAAAAPEDDVLAVQVRARRRRGCVRTGGDQERQFKILGSGK